MFQTDLLSIISSLNSVYRATGICHASYVDCLLSTELARQLPIAVYTVFRLLMIDSEPVRNM